MKCGSSRGMIRKMNLRTNKQLNVWSAATCRRFALNLVGAFFKEEFYTWPSTGRDRSKRRQVGALQSVAASHESDGPSETRDWLH